MAAVTPAVTSPTTTPQQANPEASTLATRARALLETTRGHAHWIWHKSVEKASDWSTQVRALVQRIVEAVRSFIGPRLAAMKEGCNNFCDRMSLWMGKRYYEPELALLQGQIAALRAQLNPPPPAAQPSAQPAPVEQPPADPTVVLAPQSPPQQPAPEAPAAAAVITATPAAAAAAAPNTPDTPSKRGMLSWLFG